MLHAISNLTTAARVISGGRPEDQQGGLEGTRARAREAYETATNSHLYQQTAAWAEEKKVTVVATLVNSNAGQAVKKVSDCVTRITSIQEQMTATIEKVNNVMDNPGSFTQQAMEGATAGVISGILGKKEKTSDESGVFPVELESSEKIEAPVRAPSQKFRPDKGKERESIVVGEEGEEKEAPPPSSFLDTWGGWFMKALGYGERDLSTEGWGFIFEKLLESSTNFDFGTKDNQQVRDFYLNELKEARKTGGERYRKVTKAIWDWLNSLHIIMGGITVSSPSRNQETAPPVSPASKRSQCAEAYRALRTDLFHEDFSLSALSDLTIQSPSRVPEEKGEGLEVENKELLDLEKLTDNLKDNFCSKTVHYAVMRALDASFGKTKPSDYNKIIHAASYIDDEGIETIDEIKIEEAYLKQFGTVRHFFYKIAYDLILWLLRPLIEETIAQIVIDLRIFLKDSGNLFIKGKIEELSNYFGIVRGQASDFLEHPHPRIGRIENHIKIKVNEFGNDVVPMNKTELIQRFQDYITERYVPRPEVTVCNWRVPLLSSFTEWCVQSVRKQMVRQFLKKTNLVDGMLQEGEHEVYYAQVKIRRLIETKLMQTLDLIQQSRGIEADEAIYDLEEEKERLLRGPLRSAIDEFCGKLLTFIDIEGCNNDMGKLSELVENLKSGKSDKPVIPEIMQAPVKKLTELFGIKLPATTDILRVAMTHTIETALVAFLKEKENRCESQIQNLFEMLNGAFAYTPSKERFTSSSESKHDNDLPASIQSMHGVLEELTNCAIHAASENVLKTGVAAKHQRVVTSVNQEKQLIHAFGRSLLDATEKLHSVNSSEETLRTLAVTIDLIEDYLTHISSFLIKEVLAKDYYTDTRKDIWRGIATIIDYLNDLREIIEKVAQKNQQVAFHEEKFDQIEKCRALFRQLEQTRSPNEFAECIVQLKRIIPEQKEADRNFLISELDWFLIAYNQQMNITTWLNKRKKTREKLELLYITKGDVLLLQELTKEYQKTPKNEREELGNEINTIYRKLSGSNFIKGIIDPLKITTINDLHSVLHPRFGTSSIITKLNLAITSKEQKLGSIEEQLNAILEELKEFAPSDGELEIHTRLITMAISNRIHRFHKYLTDCEQVSVEKLEEVRKSIQEDADSIGIKVHLIHEDAERHFIVKGFISAFEDKVYDVVKPRLDIDVVDPIRDKVETLIAALGKPVHLEQIICRLVLADIAKRQKDGQKR